MNRIGKVNGILSIRHRLLNGKNRGLCTPVTVIERACRALHRLRMVMKELLIMMVVAAT